MLYFKLLLMLMTAVCVGCVHTDPALSLQPRTSMKASDYEKVLEDWTREDRLYDGLESKLFVHATFHSPEFRKTFLLRHPDVYGRGSETARRLALTLPDAGEDIEFFFSAFTTDIRWNDFDQVDSIWRVELKSNHSESVDGEVTRVKTTANLRAIYPFISDFSRTYVVRFPRTDASGKPVLASSSEEIELHFRSALGGAKLKWKLIPVATSRREPFPPTRELVTR